MLIPQLFWSQKGEWIVKVNKDTFSLDEVVHVEFQFLNTDGQFTAPVFEDFKIVSGPNMKSYMSILNGGVSSQKSYSFLLKPLKTGELMIGSARWTYSEYTWLTEPISIIISEHTTESEQKMIEKSHQWDRNDTSEPQKKRPLKRI